MRTHRDRSTIVFRFYGARKPTRRFYMDSGSKYTMSKAWKIFPETGTSCILDTYGTRP